MKAYIPNALTRQLLVSVPVNDAGNVSFAFTENKELTEYAARIVSIQSYHAGQIAKTAKGKTVVTQAVHDVAFLSIKDTNTQLAVIPLKNLSLQTPQTDVPILNLNGFDLQQSEITVGETANLTVGHEFLLLFTYEKKTK